MTAFPSANQRLMEELVQATLQQPKPTPPKRSYASFLEDFVDPISSNPQLGPANDLVSGWLETDFGSNRKTHSQSDSYLHRSDHDPVSRKLTRSTPDMSYKRDTDGFTVPPTPPLTRSFPDGSQAGSQADSFHTESEFLSSGRSSGRSLVESPLYRRMNLAANNVYMRNPDQDFPKHITGLIDHVRQGRDSPGPSPDALRHNADLYELENGAAEPEVEDYFKSEIFPKVRASGSLKRTDRQPMAKHAVPSTAGSTLKVSTPVPDMLYGYNPKGAFPQQQAQLISIGNTAVANSQDLIYPFFVIEFKGDGGMWVATNQCLGGSTSCVKIAEQLNQLLRKCESDKVQLIDSATFSVAMNGTEARLYISWKHNELDYYMQKVKSFLLQDPDHYLEFRKYVRNIIDWGKDKRLKEIRDSLDSLLEESRKRTSKAAKSRRPPSDGSATSSGKRHQSSSSRRNGSRSSSVQGQSGGADGPNWEWDEAFGRWFHVNADGILTWAVEGGRSQ